MGRQDSPLLTAANLGFLLSPFAKAVTVGGIAWQVKNDAVKVGTVEVSTAISELAPFYLRMSVNRHAPSEPRLQYLVSEKPKAFSARRLCVNAPHRPFSGTHKHLVEPGGGPEDAYEPDDIPVVPLQPRVAPGIYRAILEAFADECFITIGDDFSWVEPYGGI